MSSPLSQPDVWQAVAPHYAVELVPTFERYATEALDLAGVGPGQAVLDVACGPGTLAFLAAARGARVAAVDFCEGMIAELSARLAGAPAPIAAQVADGMDLPFEGGSFDAAFSMFGLMFFPDRGRGFAELFRVLRPGGVAVVSSWQPMGDVPLMATTFGALAADLPPSPPRAMPLVAAEAYATEMGAAGFVDVQVRAVRHPVEAPTAADFLDSMERTNAALIPLRAALGPDGWARARARAEAALAAAFGGGPLVGDFPAWIGWARKP